MQDDHYDTKDLVHGQGHLDDAGKPGAWKACTPGLEGGIQSSTVLTATRWMHTLLLGNIKERVYGEDHL